VLETTEAERLATGFIFTEGPLWHPKGYWYFVDLRQNKLFRLTPGKEPDGKRVGIIRWPEQAVNFAFGGPDLLTLLCCAHTSVYTLRVKVSGNPHPRINCAGSERGYGRSYRSGIAMTPRRYGPLPYVPITRRPKLTWPGGARIALWVNPNIEFFGLDDVMPGNLNERVPREHAKIPNVRNWAVRDYGNRIGIWRLMEVLTRHGIRASAALNSEVCDHHPEIFEEAGRLGWELIGHNQTNALRLTEMDAAEERDAVRATIDRIEAASGKRPVGWLGAGLAETWSTLDYLAEAGIRYVCDWVNDDQPYLFNIGSPRWCHYPIRFRPTTCRPTSR
jgi:hypothetical protein